MRLIVILAFMLSFISCGKDSALFPKQQVIVQKVAPAVPEEFSYELKQGSCTTGKHTSESFFAICEKLLNHSANNDCALDKRRKLFESASCVGEFI